MAVSTIADDKKKALNLAIAQIEKSCGKGSIMRMDEKEKVRVEAVPTGAINLDAAIGVGGIPRGRVTEIYGPESSGKTTLCLHVVANAQKMGGVAAFIDAEHALDTEYARKLGVDVESLLISQPDTGEQALEICEILVRSGAVDIVVVDSVAALVPKAEIEGDMGDSHVGLQARLMSQALRKLTGAIARSKTIVIFINQLREKIGVMFGNPETTTGGKALKFYASLRLDIRRIGPVKEKEDVVGSHVRVKVVKNKVAPPFKQAEFDIMYAEGISHTSLLVDIGSEANIIEKSGAWYSYKGQKIGQGRENAKMYLKDNPAIMAEIEEQVKGVLGIGADQQGAPPEAEDTEETPSFEGARAVRLWHCKCEKFSSRAKRDDRQNEAGESLSGSDGARNPHRDRERSPAFFYVPPSLPAGPARSAAAGGPLRRLMAARDRPLGTRQSVPPGCGAPPPALPITTTPEAACP
jgi:recombination protein RecA